MILRDQILKETMEVGPGCRVRILIDHKAGTGMLYKDRDETGANAAALQNVGDLVGNLIGPLPTGGDDKALGEGFHDGIPAVLNGQRDNKSKNMEIRKSGKRGKKT
jgi:hypothetical protein